MPSLSFMSQLSLHEEGGGVLGSAGFLPVAAREADAGNGDTSISGFIFVFRLLSARITTQTEE